MEYNSFYGGRRGASFVIVKKYRTIFPPAVDNEGFNKVIRIDMGLEVDAEITEEIRNNWLSENCMVTCFQQGGDYLVANYDEYVIIDTYNKNDIDNGKIYRRGYDYTNELGGAIYIGQIVGPAGMAPHTELKEYDVVAAMTTEDGLVIPNDGTTISDESLNQYRKTQATLDTATKDLLPGHYYDEEGNDTFNDTIEYIACSIKDFESHESTVHIGFKVPYHVIRYTAESVSPYYHRTDDAKYMAEEVGKGKAWDGWSEEGETTNFSNAELVQRTDDETHPFFSQWHISIPKGIKGETFKNFRITTAAEVDGLNIKFDENNNAPADYRETSDTYKKQILVYDYYNYDRDINGDPVSSYLGDYNMIENIALSEDGTVTIDYTHDEQDIYPNLFKWINSVSLNEENGLFQVEYNYPTEPDSGEATLYTTNLTWIKDIALAEDGTVTWSYTTSEDDKVEPNYIKWVKSVALDPENGHFTMIFNYPNENDENSTPTQYDIDLTWLKDLTISEDGTINWIYTTEEDNREAKNFFKWISNVSLDVETGEFLVDFNYGEDSTQVKESLTWVKEIEVSENGTITWTYTNLDDKIEENKIKWIKQVEISSEQGAEDEGHLKVTYNTTSNGTDNDVYETDLKWVNNISLSNDGLLTLHYSGNGSNIIVNTDNNIKWMTATSIATDGTITITYNTGETDVLEEKIKWITNTELASDGTFTVTYNDNTTYVAEDKLKWIEEISLDNSTGEFKVTFNNGDEPLSTSLRTPNDITINTGDVEGEGTQKIVVHYNTGEESQEIGNPINYIMRTAVSSDYHLLVLHSDPAKRQAIKEAGENYSFDGRDDWQDMGAIKDYDGLLVGMNVSVADVPAAETKEGAVEYLNATYPDGLTTSGLEGKIVTVGTAEDDKLFYAYDYNSKSWYYLGGVQFDVVTNVAGKESDENTQALAEKMSTNGIWFVVE